MAALVKAARGLEVVVVAFVEVETLRTPPTGHLGSKVLVSVFLASATNASRVFPVGGL